MPPRLNVGLPILAAAAGGLLVMACSPPQDATSAEPQPTSQDVASLAGSHQLQGRTVLVRLPYHREANQIWVSAEDDAEVGPFVFQTIDVEPGSGPGGTDVSVFEYRAEGPGTGTLRFGLVPAGKSLIGPPETRHKGEPFASYTVTVTVK